MFFKREKGQTFHQKVNSSGSQTDHQKEYFPLEFHSRLQEFILKTIPKTLIMVVVLTIPMSKP